MIATFQGEHGSLGYKTGKDYLLNIYSTREFPIVVEREDTTGVCPYGSIEKFFENWSDFKQCSVSYALQERVN